MADKLKKREDYVHTRVIQFNLDSFSVVLKSQCGFEKTFWKQAFV